MQQVAVDVVSPEMFEGTGHRLRHLNRKVGGGIIRQSMILASLIGELCLQKKISSRYHTRTVRRGQPLPDAGFEVVPALVRRVDATKAHADCEFGESWSALFFPGGAVEEDGQGLRVRHPVILP